MRIFDCVMVGSERDLDLLEARMTEYEDIPEVVHVICEAPVDHDGTPKPKHFLEHRYSDRFMKFHGKWNHVEVEPHELPAKQSPKTRKDALREYLAHGVPGEPGDVVLHGGIDEIPAPWVLREIITGETIALPIAMEMRWCAYSPDRIHPRPWRGTVAQRWEYAGSFAGIREQKNSLPAIVNAGTRLSMLGEESQETHPDGHALWKAEVDDTYPRWVLRDR